MRTDERAVLSQRLRARDAEAFAELWAAQERLLFSIAAAVVGDQGRAEAALRQTLELAWAGWEQARRAPARWLTSVLGSVLPREDLRAGQERVADEEGARARVLAALDPFSDEERALVVLHHLGGLDAESLARLTRRKAGAVRRALQRGTCAIAGLRDPEALLPKPQGGDERGGNHAPPYRRGCRRRARVSSRAGEGPLRHR